MRSSRAGIVGPKAIACPEFANISKTGKRQSSPPWRKECDRGALATGVPRCSRCELLGELLGALLYPA